MMSRVKKTDEAQTSESEGWEQLPFFWLKMIQAIEPEIRGTNVYYEGTGWT